MRHRSKREEEVLGSRISVSVVSDECQKQLAHNAIQQCFLESYRIQRSFSRFIPDSELSNLNKNVGEWTRVSDELFLLIRFSKEIQEMTGGAYDPTVCSILEGWGYDPEYSLNEKHPGHTGAIEFGKEQFVRITAPIDLGGIGKGYALDRMKNILQDFPDVFLDAGGDLFGRGRDENDLPWKTVFEHPTDPGLAIGETRVDGFFLAASSPAKRRWRNRHHLVDPLQKIPASDMQIVYTQAEKGILADALSTALFTMGFAKAKAMLSNIPGEAMVWGKTSEEIFISPGFRGILYAE
jgi:thiamine biosynthesis lipoprotein